MGSNGKLITAQSEGNESLVQCCAYSTNNLGKSVLFLGKSNEVDDLLCYSDLFLLPSEKESFGLAALEAMIHKVPVISSNVGGLPEVNIEKLEEMKDTLLQFVPDEFNSSLDLNLSLPERNATLAPRQP